MVNKDTLSFRVGGEAIAAWIPPWKNRYSIHHLHYGNTKDVLYVRKVYYMNKIQPNCDIACLACEIEIDRKNINPFSSKPEIV